MITLLDDTGHEVELGGATLTLPSGRVVRLDGPWTPAGSAPPRAPIVLAEWSLRGDALEVTISWWPWWGRRRLLWRRAHPARTGRARSGPNAHDPKETNANDSTGRTPESDPQG